YVGIYSHGSPRLLLRDPELIKQITVKESNTFNAHTSFASEKVDPLWAKNLAALKGERWHDMRSTLTPAFTGSKLRMMFELMKECAENLTNYFLKQEGTVTVELKDVFTRFANDVIGTAAFGVTCNSFENRENEFYLKGQELSKTFIGINAIKFLFYIKIPKVMEILKVPVFPKSVSTFFRGLIQDTLKVRREKGIIRPDMVHLLMEAKQGRLEYIESDKAEDSGFAVTEDYKLKKSQKDRKPVLTDEDIVSQALVFFSGGFDTTSTLMTFVSYELAANQEVQQKLREEVDAMLIENRGRLTYENVMKMKYLDMVVSETLRKWPPIAGTDRVSCRPFTIEPELSGETSVLLESGTSVAVPIFQIHKDPQYYPDPEKFDPERFNDENENNIKPFTYSPFGVGARSCIGSRFALLECKLIITQIISKFEIIPVAQTQIPVEGYHDGFALITKRGAWVGLKPR
ncbi:hypothetical protein ILUMI_17102, partial [Ignelater luminosus]